MTVFKFHTKLGTRGFTLLEIMVSIAVLAIVMVTLFRLQSGTIRLAGHGKFIRTAPLLAQGQLTALETALAHGDPGELSGDFPDQFKGYEWSAALEDADFENQEILSQKQFKNFKKITLEINDPDKNRSYRVTTWRYFLEKDEN
jgi:general secretion pathway protein I